MTSKPQKFSVVIISAESYTQTMLRVVSLEEELLDFPEYQEVPMEVDTILVSQEGQPPFRSHTCLCLICEFGRVFCFSRGYFGLQVQRFCAHSACICGVTAGSTVAVAFEPAGPGSPPPAWPISGESVQASTTCGDRRRRSCCLRILACPFCVGSLKLAIIVETAVGRLLTTSGRCPGESRRGP